MAIPLGQGARTCAYALAAVLAASACSGTFSPPPTSGGSTPPGHGASTPQLTATTIPSTPERTIPVASVLRATGVATIAPSATSPLPASPSPSPSIHAFHYGSLAGGTYQSAPFVVPMTMTIEDGSWAETTLSGYSLELDTQRSLLDSLFFGVPTHYYIAGKDVFGSIAAEGLTVPKPQPITIGGQAAVQVEFQVPARGVGPQHGLEAGYLVLYGTPDGDVGIRLGDSARVIIMDRGDQTLVISIDAPTPEEFMAVNTRAEQLLQTVRFQ